jgi:hypothetical protein
MAGNLFVQNTIAVIWDFDKTLSRTYMQAPLFTRYKVNEKEFWDEVNGLEGFYRSAGAKRVSKDTLYLNHILTYVRRGVFKDLNNSLLKELGAEIALYEGLPHFFEAVKSVSENPLFKLHDITVEHYIVSTGLREMIMGSKIAPFVEDVWGCEFVEVCGEPGYLKPGHQQRVGGGVIVDIAYAVDNTSKTRAIFEINKGTNKLSDIGVNDTIDPEDRRVPFQNMIYVADGPSDIPSFSIVNQYGGTTFAVYEPGNKKQFEQVVDLQLKNRVHGIGEANYVEGSLSFMWILSAVERTAKRIVATRESFLQTRIGRSPQHIVADSKSKDNQGGTVAEVAKAAVESVATLQSESRETGSTPAAAKKLPVPERGSGSAPGEASVADARKPSVG